VFFFFSQQWEKWKKRGERKDGDGGTIKDSEWNILLLLVKSIIIM